MFQMSFGTRVKALRLGKRSTSCTLAYNLERATPLMLAVISGEYEAASTLVAASARLELRNGRGKRALELAQELGAPRFLLELLESSESGIRSI